jgi:predicted phage terminase large subunit-like protein
MENEKDRSADTLVRIEGRSGPKDLFDATQPERPNEGSPDEPADADGSVRAPDESAIATIYTERYKACFELYLLHNGRNLSAVEREMRARGFTDFHRRILYTRKERGREKPGWIEKFSWKAHLPAAPPPDVRKGSAFPGAALEIPGGSASALPRTGGIAADQDPSPSRRAQPFRTSNGQSPREPSRNADTSPDFPAWLKQVSPGLTWDWPYQKYIYEHLHRVTTGECKRLMIFMPPRHGKSELVTVRYAAWRLWADPKLKIIVSSYNQKLADKFSRSIRKLLSEEEDRHANRSEPPALAGGFLSSGRRENPPADAGGSGFAAAPPPGVRKGSAFPEASLKETGGCASADCRETRSADYPQCLESVPPAVAGGDFSSGRNTTPPATAGGTDRMFPRTRTINTASQWESALGGGVKAVGVGAGVTGFGGQVIIIDDPVKSRAEAESETYRERLWDWYRNDLYTRLEPGAAVILIQTRWHQDDLAGRLLQESQTGGDTWEVIDLPALSEPPASVGGQKLPSLTRRGGSGRLLADDGVVEQAAENSSQAGPDDPQSDLPPRLPAEERGHPPLLVKEGSWNAADPLGRPPGAALCPDRFDEAKLADIQRQLGTYAFSALYQQRPAPAEGGIFKRAWFTRIVDRPPENLKWKRGYDLAVSTKTTSCFTASFRIARDEATGDIYIADGFRDRIEYPDQKRYIIARITNEPDTEHGIEKALHGQALIQELRRETRLVGSRLRGINVTADKITRALTWAPLAEEGKVVLVLGPWNRAFLDELAQFPTGQHDDQIDAVSLAFSMLEQKRRGLLTF